MQQWLAETWHAHPWMLAGGALALLVVMFVALDEWRLRRLARRVARRVTGDTPTVQESRRQVQQAQRDAAQRVSDIQADMMRQVQQGMDQMHASVLEMERQVRDGQIPLSIAVTTREERQVFDAALARSMNIRASIATRRGRRAAQEKADEEAQQEAAKPTSWARILEDDENEEGSSCPTTSETPKKAPPSNPPPKKPRPKTRAPKKTRG